MRFNLGEFEEIVLLMVAAQHKEAYGMSITKAIEQELNRSVTLSSVHTSLYRLEEKGLIFSEIGGTTKSRGGRRKRIFNITDAGKEALIEARNARSHLWSLIPNFVFGNQ